METGTVVTPPYVARPLVLEPFRALRLTPSRVGDPASARLFARPLSGVQQRLDTWVRRGFLAEDDVPALYLHEYTANGVTVRGLVGTIDVSRRAGALDQRAIWPHEGIHPGQADDLADRMQQMGLDPAPILLVQESPAELRTILAAQRTVRPVSFVDRNDNTHRIWTICDPAVLARIAALIADTTAVIADGHHRYGAYLRRQQRQPGGGHDRGLAMVVDQLDTPLFLGAIHRVLTGTSLYDVATAAESVGLGVVQTPPALGPASLAPRTLVATDGADWISLHVQGPDDQVEIEVLHRVLIPALAHGPTRIHHFHTAADALDHAGAASGTAILLPAPRFDQVRAVVGADRLLPEKATSFQPKPPLGVLLRRVHDAPDGRPSPPPRHGTPGRPAS